MKVISIGRGSTNDVVIKGDKFVSREQHCLITQDDDGHYYIFDAKSKNGTYVNGSSIPKATQTRLHCTDVVRIGNTVLPWQSYFKTSTPSPSGGSSTSGGAGGPSGFGGSGGGGDNSQPTTIALQAIALILSLVGLCCIGYVAIKILSWGVFGYAFNYTTGLIGAGCSVVAYILAEIADYKEETENTTMATIAKWISSACFFTVVAFFIYWKMNPDFLNPFAGIKL